MTKPKKCQPTRCKQFKKLFLRFLHRRPVDIFFLNCPYRNGLYCKNHKEKLNRELI